MAQGEGILTDFQVILLLSLFVLLAFFLIYADVKYENKGRRVAIISIATIAMIISSFLGSINLCKMFDRCGGVDKGEDKLYKFFQVVMYYGIATFAFFIIHFFSQDECSYEKNKPKREVLIIITIISMVISLILLLIHGYKTYGGQKTQTPHTGQGNFNIQDVRH